MRDRERGMVEPQKAGAIACDVGDDLVRPGRSADRFETLAANAQDLILELDAKGHYLYVSPSCEDLLGVSVDTLRGHDLHEAHITGQIHPDDRDRVLRRFAARTTQTGPGHEQYRYRHANGSWRWFETRAGSYRNGDGEQRVVVVARDVTDRVRAEQRLRESEERYRVVAGATSDLITELDAEGRLVYASDVMEELLGYAPKDLMGTTPVALLLHPNEAESACQSFLDSFQKQSPVRTAPYRMRRRNGSWRWFESTGVPYRRADGEPRLIAVTRDVTLRLRAEQERQELETRVQQTQKLESLGVMADGIAQDFNNLLTPILGDSSLALQELPPDSPLRERLLRVQKAAYRAAALTRQMLAYAGKRPLLLEPVNLSRLVLQMADLLEGAVGPRAVLSFELESNLPPVEGDTSQLCQAVMNLISNAAEAVGEHGGRVEIRTGTLDSRQAARSATLFGWDLRPGNCIYLEVRDNGCGMDTATRRRIFDPFFSTKFPGRGLGLAAVMGIVRGHRAALEIESQPDAGTRMRVVFAEARPTRVPVPSLPPEDC